MQGWKPGKFYPDFIIKTRAGRYILMEYKVELGKLWQKLTGDRHLFHVVGKKNADVVLKELSDA